MAHQHREPEGEALSHAARAALERGGEQWTEMRARVFEALASFDRPVSAYDVAEQVSQMEGRRIAANSIYRILDLFVAQNIAQRVESANAYIANAHPECRHDCIFLVCDACGRTTHVDDDATARSVRAAAMPAGFAPERLVLEVRGRCEACAHQNDIAARH